MPRLNKVNAVLAAKRKVMEVTVTELYKVIQKAALFAGKSRTYRAFEETDQERHQLPAENQAVQYKAREVVKAAARAWAEVWDLTATQDGGNMKATADVVVDNVPVLKDVPVATLLFLGKQVANLITFIDTLPTPPADERWTFDEALGVWRSDPKEALRTEKSQEALVKFAPTDKHPGQAEIITKDVAKGKWTTVAFSGALGAAEKADMLAKARKLQAAVKEAREEANMKETAARTDGSALLKYVFGDRVLDA